MLPLLNVIGKILEHVIFERLKPKFNELGIPNNLQYAYQKNKSSMHASFVLREAIHEAVESGSKTFFFFFFFDSEKAFDTVWIDGLFFKLFNIGIRGKTWRLLRKWYSKLVCCVSVNGQISTTFPVLQGIRQGGALSPWLLLCYNNDVRRDLSSINVDLELNLVVADDIVILSPTITGL